MESSGSWVLDAFWLNSSLTKTQEVNRQTIEPPGENNGVFAYLTSSIL